LQVAVQVANTDLTVLIMGESGVGKEAFSMIIHSLSNRKHNPFIAVNCGAIPEALLVAVRAFSDPPPETIENVTGTPGNGA